MDEHDPPIGYRDDLGHHLAPLTDVGRWIESSLLQETQRNAQLQRECAHAEIRLCNGIAQRVVGVALKEQSNDLGDLVVCEIRACANVQGSIEELDTRVVSDRTLAGGSGDLKIHRQWMPGL